ncbi:reverse transcriptase family protein [Leisingera caerulea]|uniref:Reverse transcriptase family protein n=1 Tax=Leisingera caerulea TaxID=506591 RepID=A0A9Q9M2S5_LEICA|nr:reverse transcriptase family protein [Leisingera caerulea]UWQ55957.1 reverse transcriptase family protein [Leisingera caerulea]
MQKQRARRNQERYELNHSPFAQNPTQRDVADLVREKRDDLERLGTPRFKEHFLVRRTITSGGKERQLVYPVGRLRAAHERLRFHFSKIVQRSYLMSPRKGKAQRDNAAAHISAAQYLTLDLKQFYPSTSRSMIRKSLVDQFGMHPDVAGLIAHVGTADDRACFGSPLTPVLASLVHRPMFDAIADLCIAHDLSFTVWVDDLTISGSKIPGGLVKKIRETVSSFGLKTHKLKVRTGNKPVFITGVGVVGSNLIVPRKLEMKSKTLWAELKNAETLDELDVASTRLLAHLGGIRHVVGSASKRGQKIASEMNSIRQKREKAIRINNDRLVSLSSNKRYLTPEELEARKDEIDTIAF